MRRFAVLWQSALILVVLGVPAAVFANTITEALSSKQPDFVYVVAAGLLIILLIGSRVAYELVRSIRRMESELDASTSSSNLPLPARRDVNRSLADLLTEAREEVLFVGIVARRSVSDDAFRRILEQPEKANIRLRFLLTDPEAQVFSDRAKEEGESADAWRHDHTSTINRLRNLHSRLGFDISVRITRSYPIWRIIVVDRSQVWVNTFLPGLRGTESVQWELAYPRLDLAYGFLKYAEDAWSTAQSEEIAL